MPSELLAEELPTGREPFSQIPFRRSAKRNIFYGPFSQNLRKGTKWAFSQIHVPFRRLYHILGQIQLVSSWWIIYSAFSKNGRQPKSNQKYLRKGAILQALSQFHCLIWKFSNFNLNFSRKFKFLRKISDIQYRGSSISFNVYSLTFSGPRTKKRVVTASFEVTTVTWFI